MDGEVALTFTEQELLAIRRGCVARQRELGELLTNAVTPEFTERVGDEMRTLSSVEKKIWDAVYPLNQQEDD